MNQMTPTNPVNPVNPLPPQVVQTPTKSWLGWIIGAIIVVLAAVALIFWMSSREVAAPTEELNALPAAEVVDQVALTPGDSLAEIEQDLTMTELESLDNDIATLEQDAAQVP